MNFITGLSSATLSVALVASAHAADFSLDMEGEATFGFNDQLPNNTYLESEVTIEASQTFDNGFGWALTFDLEGEKFGWGEEVDYDDAVLLEVLTPIGTLAYGDMNKKGASELFYNDLDGMDIDVVRYKDGYPSLRWHGDIGDSFSYAVSSRNVINDIEETSVGFGYETDRFELGLAWDRGSEKQDEAYAATVEAYAEHGNAEMTYTLSYIETAEASAFGIGVEAEFDSLTIEASYAFNNVDGVADGYGLGVEYEQGPWAIEATYEDTGEEEETEIAVAYELADFAPNGTTVYMGHLYEEGSEEDTGYYAGVGFGIADNTTFGVAYSETDEGGDLIVEPGWSMMLTVAF